MFGENLYIDTRDIVYIRYIKELVAYEIGLRNGTKLIIKSSESELQYLAVRKYILDKYKGELK